MDDRNLSSKSVLLDLADTVGLDPKIAVTVVEKRLFSDAVDADWRLAEQQNISVVPTLIMGTERLVGARPYGAMESWWPPYVMNQCLRSA